MIGALPRSAGVLTVAGGQVRVTVRVTLTNGRTQSTYSMSSGNLRRLPSDDGR